MREGSKQVEEALYKLELHTDHLALFTRPRGRHVSKKRLSQPQSPHPTPLSCHHQCPPSPHSHPSLVFAFVSVSCSIHGLVPFSLPLSLPSLLCVVFTFMALLTPSPPSLSPSRVAFVFAFMVVCSPSSPPLLTHVRIHGCICKHNHLSPPSIVHIHGWPPSAVPHSRPPPS
jgi:hypothetical protein